MNQQHIDTFSASLGLPARGEPSQLMWIGAGRLLMACALVMVALVEMKRLNTLGRGESISFATRRRRSRTPVPPKRARALPYGWDQRDPSLRGTLGGSVVGVGINIQPDVPGNEVTTP